jgi:hypothetical protein
MATRPNRLPNPRFIKSFRSISGVLVLNVLVSDRITPYRASAVALTIDYAVNALNVSVNAGNVPAARLSKQYVGPT